MAQLLSASLSCLKPKDDDPCYECEGCAFADLWFMFHRGRMLISCGKDSLQQVFEFGHDLQHQSQFPLLRRRYSIVFDEAHELKPDMQARVLPLMEITPNTSFIFCTTHTDKLSGAILARSHTIRLAPLEPSVAQAALLRIAKAEGIALGSQEALDLASKGEGIPRECLKLLQLHCAKAALPPGEEFGTTRTESRFR